MKVAMVSEHASPLAALGGVDAGGQNVHVAAIATELGRRGVPVTVYTRRDSPDLPRRVAMAPGVTVEHVVAGPTRPIAKDDLLPFMSAFARQLRRRWSTAPPDVVHAHFWMSGLASVRAAHPLGIPVVQTFHALGVVKRRHQGTADTSPPSRLAVESGLVQDVDHLLATCTDEMFELVRLGGDPARISIVPCGVDLKTFRPDGPVESRADNLHRIVVVGRLVARKGVETVIDALADLPDAQLVIAGGPGPDQLDSDPEVRRLQMRAASLPGVADRVQFRGRVDRQALPALIRSADAVVCMPWYEPFGIVPLEAMACGVPVVAAAVGGLTDTVVHGRTGLHVAPRDPDQLAKVLRQLFIDRDWRTELGRAGRRRAESRYSWQRVVDGTLAVYQAVQEQGWGTRQVRLS
jgi:glycosyltransferase involved in cell wall biosynthesis